MIEQDQDDLLVVQIVDGIPNDEQVKELVVLVVDVVPLNDGCSVNLSGPGTLVLVEDGRGDLLVVLVVDGREQDDLPVVLVVDVVTVGKGGSSRHDSALPVLSGALLSEPVLALARGASGALENVDARCSGSPGGPGGCAEVEALRGATIRLISVLEVALDVAQNLSSLLPVHWPLM
eukprot:3603183-Amphidinium_carterae.1